MSPSLCTGRRQKFVHRHKSLAALALWSALGSACASWQPTTVGPENLQGRDVTVYTDSTSVRLENVRSSDTLLVGEAWGIGRDTAIRVTEIDSVRVRRPNVSKTLIAVIGTALSAITLIMLIDSPDSL